LKKKKIGSGITQLKKNDLNYLQMDLKNKKQTSSSSSTSSASIYPLDFNNQIEQLKRTFVPMYHLDFDHLNEIDDAAFDEFLIASTNLTFHLESLNETTSHEDNEYDVLLRVRFSNCNFQFGPHRRPFKGLKAQEMHMNNMRNEYLSNSIFDGSLISELHLENSLNFIGFMDLSDTLPTGSFKTDI
jgi:hypothetical protein